METSVSDKPRVYGLLLTFRRQHLLPLALEAIRAQTTSLDQLLVIDNENSPATRAVVERFRASWERTELLYTATPTNLGPAGGWAFGMRQVLEHAGDHDWIMPLDDDDPPKAADDFQRMIDFAVTSRTRDARLAAVGIVGARVHCSTGLILRVPDDELHGAVPVELVGSGHLALYQASALRAVGPFDERLFFGYEELDLGLRLRRAGYRVVAHGDLWRERREAAGHLNTTRPLSLVCLVGWRRYYSIRNYLHIMKQRGRWDIVLRHVLLHCLVKPAWTLFAKPANAVPGFLLAVRACADGLCGRMGRRVEPGTG